MSDRNTKFTLFFHIILIFSPISLYGIEKCVRGGGPWGFFAEFLWALNHIEYSIANNKIPVIYWGKDFSYNSFNCDDNIWDYYFEPISPLRYRSGDPLHTEPWYHNFSTLWWYCQYIDNKCLLTPEEQKALKPIEDHERRYASAEFDDQRQDAYPVGKYNLHLYSKQFRQWVKEKLLDPFIKIKPDIQQKIDSFYETHMKEKKTIGLHLRGNHLGKEVLSVPRLYLFEEANNYADLGYQFFIATDQEPLIEEAKKQLRGPVIYYECQRFNETTSPYPGKKLDPQLGEDLLIETLLLSKCDHFIHTISNVSTAVLYFNPELSHTVIY
jgi:hypothetical protein